jgi:hypothetical protein
MVTRTYEVRTYGPSKAGLDGACLHEPADRSGPDALGGDGSGSIDPGEERTLACGADLKPGAARPDARCWLSREK